MHYCIGPLPDRDVGIWYGHWQNQRASFFPMQNPLKQAEYLPTVPVKFPRCLHRWMSKWIVFWGIFSTPRKKREFLVSNGSFATVVPLKRNLNSIQAIHDDPYYAEMNCHDGISLNIHLFRYLAFNRDQQDTLGKLVSRAWEQRPPEYWLASKCLI